MKFNRLLISSYVFITLFACSQKNNSGGSIQGTLTNASGATVYLQEISDAGEKTLDSVQTDDQGNFTLKNPIKDLDYYVLRTDPTNVVFLILKGGEKIEIKGDAKNLDATYEVTGSEDSKLIQQLRRFEKNLGDSLNKVFTEFRNIDPMRADSIGRILQQHYANKMQNYCSRFIEENMKSLASLSATKYLDQNKSLELMAELGKNLENTMPDNKYIKEYLGLVKQLSKLPVGSEAPEISLPTPEGKTASLSSLRGKVVLVDFWASWCSPCRKENPNVVAVYQKYKSKGFEVFGVSLDDNAEAWKIAIQKDGLVWNQVSELKKWDSQIAKTYGVDAIPFSVLLDKEGKIIGKGLRGEELENKVREALGINS